METILDIVNVNLSFASSADKEDRHFLFKNLTLKIPKQKISAIVGGNGAGKTTLFNVISGIQKSTSGSVYFNGKLLAGLLPYQIARLGIGRLFQGARVFEEISILDNMLIGEMHSPYEQPFFNLLFYKKNRSLEKQLSQKAENILASLFGNNNIFWTMRKKAAGNLSFGQQRLLAIARLLMGDYSIYLLDEPTAGVHPVFIEQIAAALQYMNIDENKSVLLIEHNMQFVRGTAAYCFFIDDGSILTEGTVSDVLDNEYVQQSYIR